ncbi:MAG TPA: gluconokinase [Hyphomicrobiaceae bacterium]|nr:gluconokinase [Hyphomicrobiaceae bacterium]
MSALVIVLMGVSSSGKSTIGARLAKLLDWPFRDADSFHPAANIEKMRAGIPLEDSDRWPWLDAIAHWIDQQLSKGQSAIVSCSALKRSYRQRLIGDRRNVRLVFLKGSFELIKKRMQQRRGHFMPLSLLHSQFQVLEEPEADEHAITVSISAPPQRVAHRIISALGLATAGRS